MSHVSASVAIVRLPDTPGIVKDMSHYPTISPPHAIHRKNSTDVENFDWSLVMSQWVTKGLTQALTACKSSGKCKTADDQPLKCQSAGTQSKSLYHLD